MEGVTLEGRVASGRYAFLFSDICDSTEKWVSDPPGMSRALAVHDEIMRDVIESGSGLLFTTAGDSFSCAFMAPEAALATVLAARDRLVAQQWEVPGSRAVRFGLHVGWAEWRLWDSFGPEVIKCARLLDVADLNEVVASAEFVAEVDRGRFLLKGEFMIEGFPEPATIYRVG